MSGGRSILASETAALRNSAATALSRGVVGVAVTPGAVATEAAPAGIAVLEASVRDAVSLVCDPEYPDVTIAELGILERVAVSCDGSAVCVELVPTMLGCPALDLIARDVTAAARSACSGSDVSVEVVFVDDPVWTPARIAPSAVEFMAREYTVAVPDAAAGVTCPICGSVSLEHRSDFGPTPCRSVTWCPKCRNPVEVVGRAAIRLRSDGARAPAASAASGADRSSVAGVAAPSRPRAGATA